MSFQVLSLWLSHGTATMVSKNCVSSPPWPGKRSPTTQSSTVWGSRWKGEWDVYSVIAVSLNTHLSWKLFFQGNLSPALSSVKQSWHFSEAKSGVSAMSSEEHQNIQLCLPLFYKNLGSRIPLLNVCPPLKPWGIILFWWTLGTVLTKDNDTNYGRCILLKYILKYV